MIAGFIPGLPPSVNKMYVNDKWGGKRPSSALKKFQAMAMSELSKQWMWGDKLDQDLPYRVTLVFVFPAIENKTWGSGAKRRFKKFDASNYIKAVEDIVSTVTGVDDSSFLSVTATKIAGEPSGVFVYIESEDGLTAQFDVDGELSWMAENGNKHAIQYRRDPG